MTGSHFKTCVATCNNDTIKYAWKWNKGISKKS